jgi:hypothetical protein
MLKQLNLIIILSTSFFLTGCAADSGNTKLAKTSNDQINSTFEKGKTTQTEVKEAFGEPNDTDIMSDGKVKWIYTHIKSSAMMRNYIPVVNWFSAGTDDTTKKLVLIFKDGILVDFSSSSAKGETKAGLLR